MDDRFFNGLIGSPAKVCHYELKALTPWHLLILSAINSPVNDPEQDCTVDDLLVCLKVLQTEWPQVPEFKSTMLDKWWAFNMRRLIVARQQFNKFSEWIKVQLSFPEFWESSKDDDVADTSNMPNILALITGIVCNSNITLYEAWNMRLSEARWYQVGIAHNNGAEFKIVDESQPMPELGEVKPEEAVEAARKTLPPEIFKKWHEGFKNNQQK